MPSSDAGRASGSSRQFRLYIRVMGFGRRRVTSPSSCRCALRAISRLTRKVRACFLRRRCERLASRLLTAGEPVKISGGPPSPAALMLRHWLPLPPAG